MIRAVTTLLLAAAFSATLLLGAREEPRSGASPEPQATQDAAKPPVIAPGEEPQKPPALTEGDVVRMLAAGKPEESIVKAIQDRPVSFDLSEEMVAELKQAGVSEHLLAVMTARQREMEPKAAPVEEAAEPAPGFAILKITFPADAKAAAALYLPTVAGKDLAERLQLQALPQDRQLTDIAIFVACRTRAHVPGLWRSASPLGRDFVTLPPHQILAFHSGARRVKEDEVPPSARKAHPSDAPPEWLRLDVPQEIVAQVEKNSSHDLLVGVAVLAGDHYMALCAGKANEVMAATELSIAATIRDGGGHGQPFEVVVDRPPEAKAPKPEPPPPQKP